MSKIKKSIIFYLIYKEEQELNAFASQFETCYTRRICQKLGLFTPQDGEVPASDQLLAVDLLQLMLNHEADYTNTFVRLTLDRDGQEGHDLDGTEPLFSTEAFSTWKTLCRNLLFFYSDRP